MPKPHRFNVLRLPRPQEGDPRGEGLIQHLRPVPERLRPIAAKVIARDAPAGGFRPLTLQWITANLALGCLTVSFVED